VADLAEHALAREDQTPFGVSSRIVVDKDVYFLELSGCVVLNPVRAGMVAAPVQWP
jgi:hypothetical protein